MPRGVYERPPTKGAHGPARVGHRQDNVLVTKPAPAKAEQDVYVCGNKPLKFNELTLTAGVEVPGAAKWPRLHSWVAARRIRLVDSDEKFTTFLEFTGSSYESWLEDAERDKQRKE